MCVRAFGFSLSTFHISLPLSPITNACHISVSLHALNKTELSKFQCLSGTQGLSIGFVHHMAFTKRFFTRSLVVVHIVSGAHRRDIFRFYFIFLK